MTRDRRWGTCGARAAVQSPVVKHEAIALAARGEPVDIASQSHSQLRKEPVFGKEPCRHVAGLFDGWLLALVLLQLSPNRRNR